MKFYAELRSKKELEANFPRLAMAFIALAEELLDAEELREAGAAAEKKAKSAAKAKPKKKKPPAKNPALPLVCDSKKS